MQKLRILFVTGYYKPYLGGIERCIDYLSKYMIARTDKVEKVGIMTTHFAFKRKFMPNLSSYEVLDNGVVIYRISSIPEKISIPYFSFPLNWYSMHEIKHVINTFNPNIINWHGDGWFIGNNAAAMFAKKNTGIIFNPHFHPQRFDIKLWLKPIDMEMYMRSNKVINVTEYEKDLVKKEFMIFKKKQVVIPWGIDSHEIIEASSNHPFRILCVGRIGVHKNQKYLIDLWNQTHLLFNKKTQLVFVGRDEDTKNTSIKLQNYVKSLNISSDDIIFTNEISDSELQKWYLQSDLFCLFSNYEAFGLVFAEALSYGLPVLTHLVKPLDTIFKEGVVFVEKNNRVQASEALIKLVNDNLLRSTLSKRGKQFSKNFSWDIVVNKYLQVYESTIT